MFKIAAGSFLPAVLLINKGLVDPSEFIIDGNTGALIPHYAAHYGNLKFIRYLEKRYAKISKNAFPEFRDNFNCTMMHYAVRQGHLPVLMYCAEVLEQDMSIRDKFGYNILEYSLMYKKLNCFIYLIFNRKFKDIAPGLVESIA